MAHDIDQPEATRMFDLVRSVLFVPANDERKWLRARDSGADAVILDLEDAIAPAEKELARNSVRPALMGRSSTGPLVLVRTNGLDTAWAEADLAMIDGSGADGIVVPKAEGPSLSRLALGGLPVIAIIETATGLQGVREVATHPRVCALLLGGADLSAELGLEYRPDGQELLYARSQVVMASAAAGLRSPIDVVYLDIRADDGLRAETLLARSLGMGAKACIHPGQVSIVNEVLTPSPAEVASATEVVALYAAAIAEGTAVAVLNGKMIDLPLVLKAERTLSMAGAMNAH
jgi:citrate lyase subunit beta/citryl-CoA lyase